MSHITAQPLAARVVRWTTSLFLFLFALLNSADVLAAGTGRNLEKTFARLHQLVEEKEAADRDQAGSAKTPASSAAPEDAKRPDTKKQMQIATFGNGCFWCTEAVFEELHGVHDVVSGYTGGRVDNPTYRQVCTGLTGHAEVIQMKYDPAKISYARLLEVFLRTHDPTTLNRQGRDVGTQYRSAVFYHSDDQREVAKLFKSELNKAKSFRRPVVTEITKFKKFYPAENYHQDYFKAHGRMPYCQQVIRPKMTKFRRTFREDLAAVAERKEKNEAKKDKGKKQ